jgi:hypothetical protein
MLSGGLRYPGSWTGDNDKLGTCFLLMEPMILSGPGSLPPLP